MSRIGPRIMPPERRQRPKHRLSQRELEVLELALAGHRVKQIARLTHRSEHTIRNRLKKIYGFLNAHDLADALIRAPVRGDLHFPAAAPASLGAALR